MPLIQIFNGKRGIGVVDDDTAHVQIAFALKRHLQEFKGARLNVFLAIVLHSNAQGMSWPSNDTLSRLTGYNATTISKAVHDLCDLTLNGEHVLAYWRERDDKGKFTGSNRYLIFPTAGERAIIASGGNVTVDLLQHINTRDNPPVTFPDVDFATCGKSHTELESDSEPESDSNNNDASIKFVYDVWVRLCRQAGSAKHPAGLSPSAAFAELTEQYSAYAVYAAMMTIDQKLRGGESVSRPWAYTEAVISAQEQRRKLDAEAQRSLHDALPTFGESDEPEVSDAG